MALSHWGHWVIGMVGVIVVIWVIRMVWVIGMVGVIGMIGVSEWVSEWVSDMPTSWTFNWLVSQMSIKCKFYLYNELKCHVNFHQYLFIVVGGSLLLSGYECSGGTFHANKTMTSSVDDQYNYIHDELLRIKIILPQDLTPTHSIKWLHEEEREKLFTIVIICISNSISKLYCSSVKYFR